MHHYHPLSLVPFTVGYSRVSSWMVTLLLMAMAPALVAAAANTVTIVATDPYATKVGSTTGLFTITRTGLTTASLPVSYSVGGTAINGGDYQTLSGMLTIPAGSSSATLTVTPIPGSTSVGNQSVIVTLTVGAGYDVGTPSSDTITIFDTGTPAGGVFQFSATTYSVNEGGSFVVTITRTGGAWWAASIDVTSANVSAIAGTDYTAVARTLSFADGQSSNTFTVATMVDGNLSADSTFSLTLSNPQPHGLSINPVIGSVGAATVTIVDTNYLELATAAASINEDSGPATIIVNRTGSTAGTATVNYATGGGTAVPGTNYTATSGTLSFAPGETSKSFTVPIILSTVVNGTWTVQITLSSPTVSSGVALLGSPSSENLSILDNDAVFLHFNGAAYSVLETAGIALITVQRSGATAIAAGVAYATSNGTAVAGADYTAVNGTLSFAAGETSKTFTVPILIDPAVHADTTVNLTLSSPTASAVPAVVDVPATAVLTITGYPVASGGGGSGSSGGGGCGGGGLAVLAILGLLIVLRRLR